MIPVARKLQSDGQGSFLHYLCFQSANKRLVEYHTESFINGRFWEIIYCINNTSCEHQAWGFSAKQRMQCSLAKYNCGLVLWLENFRAPLKRIKFKQLNISLFKYQIWAVSEPVISAINETGRKQFRIYSKQLGQKILCELNVHLRNRLAIIMPWPGKIPMVFFHL